MRPRALLGVFPAFDRVGGIQASGREAWAGLVQANGAERSYLHTYVPSSSKARAIVNAASARRRADLVLVWHMSLLRLVPLLTPASRVIVFLHGIEAWRQPDFLTRRLLGKVAAFLSNSDYTWSRFLNFNPAFAATMHRTVHLGTGDPLPDVEEPASAPSAVIIGRLEVAEDYKGHRQVIAAWAGVVDRIPSARLHVVGDGSLRPELEDAARQHGVSHAVIFHGVVGDEQRDRLLVESRCLVMPSRGEGFGLVYLEAMRLGRPCLVSDGDAGREVVAPPGAGLAVRPDDAAGVAEAVCRLLSPGKDWDQMSAAARHRYESHFTASSFRQRIQHAVLCEGW